MTPAEKLQARKQLLEMLEALSARLRADGHDVRAVLRVRANTFRGSIHWVNHLGTMTIRVRRAVSDATEPTMVDLDSLSLAELAVVASNFENLLHAINDEEEDELRQVQSAIKQLEWWCSVSEISERKKRDSKPINREHR